LAGTQGQKEKKCHESVYYKINYLVSANCLFSYDSHRWFLNWSFNKLESY
jgi:hypothetical protein